MPDTKLPIPQYLIAADIQEGTLRYVWDDWKTLSMLEYLDPELTGMLQRISQRAELAFMCATAEWIVYRFARLLDTSIAWAYLQAAWAMIVNVRYCGYGTGNWWQEYSEAGDWTGPVRGVICDAFERLEIAFQQLHLERTDPVRRAGLIATLAAHIMPNAEPYKRWSQAVLQRLILLEPRDADDKLGDVVPRQAMDPALSFDVAQTEDLVNRFLASLDHNANIFLSSPEGMLEVDDAGERFMGVPYVFDIEADRKERRKSGNPDGDE